MTQVYCFSGSGHSRVLAEYLADRLHTAVIPIKAKTKGKARIALVVFPVYCQNIPPLVKQFLRDLDATYAVLIATYGQISHGNVLWEASRITRAQIIAGAYIPTGHSFLGQGADFCTASLDAILDRVAAPQPAEIPRCGKNPFASFAPAWRSRIGLRLDKTEACNACGLCTRACPMGAMQNGTPDRRCIRCLRCVSTCPQKALRTRMHPILSAYLRRQRNTDAEIYL